MKINVMSKRQLAVILGQIRCNPLAVDFTDILTIFLLGFKHLISHQIKSQLRETKFLGTGIALVFLTCCVF